MQQKSKQVQELEGQAEHIKRISPEKGEVVQEKKVKVESRFQQLSAPLAERKKSLMKKKDAFQFRRDVEDEKLWISEKMPIVSSTEYGNSLFQVNVLLKKNQVSC